MQNIILASIESQIENAGNQTGSELDIQVTIGKVLSAIFGIIGVIAVIVIILGGVTYATSQGDPGKVQKGKNTILYGIIGLIIALLAFAITTFVINALQ